jgi:peptidoglycan/LPS O-acetylase OafA/YrhL
MSGFVTRRSIAIVILLIVTAASLALATPWAAPVRHSIGPHLPTYVIVLATISGVWHLVSGIASAVAQHGARSSAVVTLLLSGSAICMALAFLPSASQRVPQLLPLIGAALLAVAAAALQRRARVRSES